MVPGIGTGDNRSGLDARAEDRARPTNEYFC
jgi:hypothetical protein